MTRPCHRPSAIGQGDRRWSGQVHDPHRSTDNIRGPRRSCLR